MGETTSKDPSGRWVIKIKTFLLHLCCKGKSVQINQDSQSSIIKADIKETRAHMRQAISPVVNARIAKITAKI